MKADRLVAALLLIQARGRVTVREVARELEVSERTARRDLEALATAGVPVYSQRGRGGGWSLVGGARTDLTGFTSREIGALFLAAGPLSASPELRSALRKLTRAVPAPMRPHAEAAARAVAVDPVDWSRTEADTGGPHRHVLERAVLDGERVRLGLGATERTVHPLGLAAKAGRWYLVAGTDEGTLCAYRLSRIARVEPTGQPAIRPEGFDLAAAWRELVAREERRMAAVTVHARATSDVLPSLRRLFGGRLRVGAELPGDKVEFIAAGSSLPALVGQLAGFGGQVEVLGPPEARRSLARLGRALSSAHDSEYHEESHFLLGTYYSEDASVADGTGETASTAHATARTT
ncbi:WYL domain-containing protein [Streptomyces sp. NPDC048664]|uniref:helix-turn-helix transcriptional regulator n=1 Tax=Streptomyces sp. NPDC048664 TaxID=3154505 RepID=UPI0034426F55